MSILVKNQDMPKEGEKYLLEIRHDGTVYDAIGQRVAAIAAQFDENSSPWHREVDIADKTNKGPIVPFSARMWVEREFIKWCEENNVAKVGNALVVFMLNHDWINRDKLVKDYRNRDKEDA